MKTKIKYLILTSITAVLIFGITISVNAAESGTCGKNLTYVLDDSGTLTISGTGDMYDYDASAPWYSSKIGIKSVIINNGVTSVGNSAFSDCTSLISVTIPPSVTSVGDYAFSDCNSLKKVYITDLAAWCNIMFRTTDSAPLHGGTLYINGEIATDIAIPDGVTSVAACAFSGCASLTNVTVHENVNSIGNYAFYGCENLTNINVSDNNEHYTSIDGNVYNKEKTSILICAPGKTSITIPEGVTSIGFGVFEGCTRLTNVTVPKSVDFIGFSAFYGCENLTNINVSDNNEHYTSIDGNVYNKEKTSILIYAPGKTSITMPDGVTSIGMYAFIGCTNLTSVTIPNGITSVGEGAFSDCTSLISVTIPKSVISIGDYAFDYCTKLSTVYFTGTESEWKSIKKNYGNECLENAAVVILPNASVAVDKIYVNFKNVNFGYYLMTHDKSDLRGTFYLAAYNASDRLVGLYKENVDKNNSEYNLTEEMTVNETPAYFKAFFWNDIKPLANNVKKDIPQ